MKKFGFLLFLSLILLFVESRASATNETGIKKKGFSNNDKIEGQDKGKEGKYSFTLFNFFISSVKEKADTTERVQQPSGNPGFKPVN